jgi:phosphoglycolate phosphatase-like HAD superfamily hydrolase
MKRPVSGHNAIVIGDTPHDINCARASGMRCLAVATGMFTVDQLQAAGATRAISDLSETQAVVEYLSQDASDR